jgi:RNA polymerase sigma-70 factor (ECF subfamily)
MAPQTPSPDLFLARRAAAGQDDAWIELIARYGRRIFNLALQFAGDMQEAEDLTQEVFLRLHQNLHLYRGEVPLIGWTLRLSRNLCIDHYRRTLRERRSTVVAEEVLKTLPSSDDPQRDAQRSEQVHLVYTALGEMSEELATVVVLRDFQSWSYDELASFLELPLGTVKSRLNRGRQELARRVAARLDGGAGLPDAAPVLMVTSC